MNNIGSQIMNDFIVYFIWDPPLTALNHLTCHCKVDKIIAIEIL